MNLRIAVDLVPGLGESSFADLIASIGSSTDLTPAQKRSWATSIRQMAIYLGRPLDSLPARFAAIGQAVKALHPEMLNANPKTFANHRSNLRAALNWLAGRQPGNRREAPMEPRYRQLLGTIADRHRRDVLSPFFRFLTSRQIGPDRVSGADLEAYAAFRRDVSFSPVSPAILRRIARIWNDAAGSIAGWPTVDLVELPPRARHSGPDWEAFPKGLRADIDAYCDTLGKRFGSARIGAKKPASKTTIDTRRRELVAAVRTGVEAGIPLETLTSMSALLEPKNVETIIEAYWTRNGDRPTLYTIDLAWRFVSIARLQPDFPADKLARLEEIKTALDEHRSGGMTEKNRTLVRQVMLGDVWSKVVELPHRMIAKARSSMVTAPERAAVSFELAIAIRLLIIAPVRMKNLASIRIGHNLVRPGGPRSPWMLTFPDYDVKNRVPLEFEIDPETTAILDEFISLHRPRLAHSGTDGLVPADRHPSKDAKTLGAQITKRNAKELGLTITPHQFRHAAAAMMLRAQPGNYEWVRRVLGHKNIATTIAHYIGFESLEATRKFGSMLMDLTPARPSGHRRRRSSHD